MIQELYWCSNCATCNITRRTTNGLTTTNVDGVTVILQELYWCPNCATCNITSRTTNGLMTTNVYGVI